MYCVAFVMGGVEIIVRFCWGMEFPGVEPMFYFVRPSMANGVFVLLQTSGCFSGRVKNNAVKSSAIWMLNFKKGGVPRGIAYKML